MRRIVRFGTFEADLHTRELRKAGFRVKLPDQPFQVLAMLLARPGEMVTREELRERLWPEGAFVDFEHSLNAAVKKLREALGDSADNPRFVETLARRGYRFIAPVETEGPAAVPVPAHVRGTRLAFADVGIREKMFRVTLSGGQRDQPAPFLSSTRDDMGPAFSPDGRRVAFESWRSGVRPVWICNTDGSGCHELSSFCGDDFAGDASWSPDGRRLAFAATHRQQFHVYICAAEGGTVRRLTSDRTYDARPRWSPDGQWIYFGSTRSGGWEIWKTRADSADADATAIRITREGGIEATESPDGRYLYYAKREMSGIWRLPLGGSGDVREEKVLDLGGEGRWSLRPNGIFVLDGWPLRSPAIRFFDFATGRVSDVVALPSDWYFILSGGAFAVSPDGTWAIVTQERLTESDIMLVENFR